MEKVGASLTKSQRKGVSSREVACAKAQQEKKKKCSENYK
jgi:hypothetical protein